MLHSIGIVIAVPGLATSKYHSFDAFNFSGFRSGQARVSTYCNQERVCCEWGCPPPVSTLASTAPTDCNTWGAFWSGLVFPAVPNSGKYPTQACGHRPQSSRHGPSSLLLLQLLDFCKCFLWMVKTGKLSSERDLPSVSIVDRSFYTSSSRPLPLWSTWLILDIFKSKNAQ